jgi:photosystem II stability/assembly factor-like uncharacterized protein
MQGLNRIVVGWILLALGVLASVAVLLSGPSSAPLDFAEPVAAPEAPRRWFFPRGTIGTRELVALGGHFHGMALLWPGPTVVAGTHLGVLVSGDRGLSWQLLRPEFVVHGTARVAGAAGGTVLVVQGEGIGLQLSDDGGTTWRRIGQGLGADSARALAVEATEGRRVAVWVEGGLAWSEDGGSTWSVQPPPAALPAVLSLAVRPGPRGPLFAGTEGGLWVSRDAGRSWEPAGLEGPVSAVAGPLGERGLLFAVTRGGLSARGAEGGEWQLLPGPPPGLGPIVALAFAPGDAGDIFAMTHGGAVLAHSIRSLLAGPGAPTWRPLSRTRSPAASAVIPAADAWLVP